MIKKIFVASMALLMSANVLFAQDKQLSALFNYATYYLPEKQQAYVETYLSFDAWTMQFAKGDDGLYRAAAEITLVARIGDSITYAKKYTLNSPAIKDSSANNFNFLDLQRFSANSGIYTLELSVKDIQSNEAPYHMEQRIVVYFDNSKPSMSSPQMMASVKKTKADNVFSRHGYDMEPLLSDFIPEQINSLNVFCEVYNIQKEIGDKPFLVYFFIEDEATGRRIPNIQFAKRKQSNPLVPIITTLDITDLPSGNYNLVAELRNKDNQTMLYKKTSFFRSNPRIKITDSVSPYATTFVANITNETELNYYLDALYPIATTPEMHIINNLVKRDNLEEKQAFLYHFWADRYQLKAEEKWREYKGWLEYVEQHFSFPKTPGYRTDRGRVFLQYGPPDFIRDEKNFVATTKTNSTNFTGTSFNGEPLTTNITGFNEGTGQIFYLPYQLWRYNKLEKDEANRVFIFWDEFRDGYYKLLISNVRGELQDPFWERRLSQYQLGEEIVGEVGEQFKRGY